ncbi:obscurin-like [Anguilla rostrata]|uniref:obscurin-like n=1 Tax=Anguilla rostrata TaxID=7938 RepID=UPI0030D270FB
MNDAEDRGAGPRKEPTREEVLTSGSPEVIPTEEVASHTPRPTQDIGVSSTPEHDLSPGSMSSVPVRKWYQIDFNPAAFCKRVFQSVYSDPATRSDSSAQETNRSDRRDEIPEIKSEVFSNTMEESVITGPPSIHKPIEDQRVERGDAAAFVAHITGFPAPEVSWCKDGKPLSASKRVKLTENSPHFSLTLVNTGSADSGMYTCTARNADGEASCSAVLTVERGFGEWAVYSTVMKRQRRSLQSLYEIHEEIGRGSFGIVKCVTSRESGESHAAKFLPLKKGSRRRAFEERDLLARITHPRVAGLLDSFRSQQTLVLLTELCSSHGLLDHLLSKVTVKEREMGMYIQQVSEGIEYIHRLHILHLDINPTNILMTLEKEEVKICDFGFSQKIDPSRYQYSKFGTPEFVAPEIVCQAPVTKATDIWSLGVLSYLCLTCHCPFSGESDRATLLSVRDGNVSWDSPDVTSRSRPAQDFLHRLLQPEPNLRPTAAECLRHEWLRGTQADQESADISTKNLTFFISRSKQQRSQICYGSAMKLQTIADLLAAPPQDTSLAGPSTKQSQESSSISSGSSSEYDEVDEWATPLFILNEGRENRHLEAEDQDPEPPDGIIALEIPSKERQTKVEATWREDTSEQDSQRGALTAEWPIGQLTRGDSTSSQGTEDEGSTGGRVPRESLIKSTFYSSSEELSPLSARRILLRQKKRTKRMERSRVCLRSGFSSRLGEPLLEHMEDSAEEDEGGSQRRGSSQSSVPLTKSCSFDSGPIACSNAQRQRRSRSLDEYSRRATSTSELRELGEDEDENDAFSSQEVLGQDKKDKVPDAFSESMAQSADTVMETQEVLKVPYFEKAKDYSSEFTTDEVAEVPQPTSDDSIEAAVSECIASDSLCLSEDIKGITSSACPAERVDGSVNTELWKDTKDHSVLRPIFVDSTMPVSVVQDVSESLASNYTISLLERPRSMDLSFEAIVTLDLENRAHFPKIHRVRSDEVISKPSDLALLVPELVERAHSAVCGMSALEDACGFKSPSSKKRDTVEIPAEISIKRADSFQELFLCAPQDEELCDSVAKVQCFVPEPEGKPSCSEDDYEMVDPAEEVYPGLLEDKESYGYVFSSATNLHDRDIKEVCGGAEAHPGIMTFSDETFEVLEGTMLESSSGKASPYMHPESCEDNESDLELKNLLEEIHTYDDHGQMTTTENSGWSDSRIPVEEGEFLARSGSLKVLHRGSIDIEAELQRYPSTPSLETKTLPGKSGRIMGFFRQHSWTSQSSSPVERVAKRQASEGDSSDSLQQQQEQLKNPDLSITKRVRASVSCFSKSLLGRQTSKEDKKDSEPVQAMGVGMKSSPPFPCKSPEAPAVSPKRSPGLFSFKFPGFKRSKGPVFLEELADQAVSLGQEVTLWCRLSGHPSPDVRWYKEARRLKTSDQIRLAVTHKEFLSLTIYSAKEEDLGSYRCVASNAMGQASTSCTLIVSELPTCPTGLQVYQLQGDEVLLVWRPVESITELSYCIEYSRDGREWRLLAEGMADSYYTASNLSKVAQYQFRVACLNRAGKGSFSEPSVPITIRAEQQDLLAPLIYTESTGSLGLTGQIQFSLSTLHKTYSFLSEINRGRFSVVKQCREDQSGQLLAGKITPFKPKWRQWALREYQLLRRLNHAHLVQLQVAFITPRYLVLILELCQGQDLFHHLAERDLYGEMHVQAFLQQILSVANYMHRRRVAHLDLKSDNILVTEQSVLKVVDLGSAHVFTPGQPVFTERLLEISESKAPEVLEGQGVGPETDIWAIGVLAFIMLSADEPFHTESHCEREHSMKKGKLQFGRCYSGLSEGALNFMKRALNTKPQSRPSAAECLQMPWIQGARQPSKYRDAVVCFTTDKLRAYLQERELRRWHAHAELEARHTQPQARFPSSHRRHSDCTF